MSKIEEAILSALEMTPPELSADIYKTGIYLAGGGSMLRGLDKRISMKTKLACTHCRRSVKSGSERNKYRIEKYRSFPILNEIILTERA